MSESNESPPPVEGVAAADAISSNALVETLRTHSRWVLFAGLGLMFLAVLPAWWSLTRYRVPAERGVNLGLVDVTKDMDEDDKREYEDDKKEYDQAWALNQSQFQKFYVDHLGNEYADSLTYEEKRSQVKGTAYFRGWSTWTGWFGVLAVLATVAVYQLPQFKDEFRPWAWTAPWVGAAAGGLYLLMAAAFYFNVPDDNGPGYSQGVSLGNYLAMLGGLAALVGGVFEGLKAADRRLEDLQSEPAEPAEPADEETTASEVERSVRSATDAAAGPTPPPPAPPSPPKNRLMDW